MNDDTGPEPVIEGRPPGDGESLPEQPWDAFREAGLMWFVNRLLHLFGWALVAEVNPDEPTKTINVYPARTTFRGFCADAESRGFKALTAHLDENMPELRAVAEKLDPPPLTEEAGKTTL